MERHLAENRKIVQFQHLPSVRKPSSTTNPSDTRETKKMTITDLFAQGNQAEPSEVEAGWTAHPSFAGVMMKPLVKGATTGGAFSTLMVKLAPGARMLPHTHEGQVEQHLVLAGSGSADLAGKGVDYAPGALLIIPKATIHSVEAGADGMVIAALFSPAIN